MNIDQMPEAGVELDRLVAKQVMKWHLSSDERDWHDSDGNYMKSAIYWKIGGNDDVLRWSPSCNIEDAWPVHQAACSWLFSKRRRYLEALQDCARTSDGLRIVWPDVLVALRDDMPRAICTAALIAIKAHRASWLVEMGLGPTSGAACRVAPGYSSLLSLRR